MTDLGFISGMILLGTFIFLSIVWLAACVGSSKEGEAEETLYQKLKDKVIPKKGEIVGLSEAEQNYADSLKSSFEDIKIK